MAEEEEIAEKPKVFTLSIRNLSFYITEEKLRDIISEFAIPKDIRIPDGKRKGQKKGFGFVEMENEEDMKKVIDGLNGKPMEDKNLIVEPAKSTPRPKKSRRGGRGKARRASRDDGGRDRRKYDDDSRSPSPRRSRRDRSPSPRRYRRRYYDDYSDDYDNYYDRRRRSHHRRSRYDYYSDDDYYDRRGRDRSPPRRSRRDRSPPPSRKDRNDGATD